MISGRQSCSSSEKLTCNLLIPDGGLKPAASLRLHHWRLSFCSQRQALTRAAELAPGRRAHLEKPLELNPRRNSRPSLPFARNHSAFQQGTGTDFSRWNSTQSGPCAAGARRWTTALQTLTTESQTAEVLRVRIA